MIRIGGDERTVAVALEEFQLLRALEILENGLGLREGGAVILGSMQHQRRAFDTGCVIDRVVSKRREAAVIPAPEDEEMR